jgi:alcohol dehydrogenase class IV
VSKAPFVAVLAGALALVAKRAYPKAALIWIVKRFLGFLLGRILQVPRPKVFDGKGSLSNIGKIILDRGCKKLLIVTDEMLVKHGLVQKCVDSINASGLEHEIFDKIVPNPPAESVEEGFKLYSMKDCDCIVAFGGGSPIDTAKVIGAKVCNPKPVQSYQGYFNATHLFLRKLPPFIAVPTTAGTGSETTIAAVISIPQEEKKIAICDFGLVPHYAILDPEIIEKLPKHITAATGMDALTHAIESFLSGWSSEYTRALSLEAVRKIMKNVTKSFDDGSDLQAREEMLDASFKAGLAFTRANVGYVHAIAHQLGGKFHTPHGDANAMLLPHILDFYVSDEQLPGCKHRCVEMYCDLAVACGMEETVPKNIESKQELAVRFVSRIREMNAHMGIPTGVPKMNKSDVKEVAARALRESHGELYSFLVNPLSWFTDLGYPTPKYMTQEECEKIVEKVLPAEVH